MCFVLLVGVVGIGFFVYWDMWEVGWVVMVLFGVMEEEVVLVVELW